MEDSIGGLAQSILDALSTAQLQAWIREAGLGHAIEMLETEVEIIDMGYAAVRKRLTGNKQLGRSLLARLKDLLYDADDLLDDLDYCRLLESSATATGSVVRREDTTIQSTYANLLVDTPTTDSSDNALVEQEDILGAVQVHEKSTGDMDIVSSQVGKRRLSAISEHYEMVYKDGNDFLLQDGNDYLLQCIHCGSKPHGLRQSDLRRHIKTVCCGNEMKAAEFSNDTHNARREQEEIFGAVLVDKKSRRDIDMRGRHGGKMRSPVWEHFEILETDENNRPVKAKCVHCCSELNCGPKHGTSGMKRHISSAGCTKKKVAADQPLNPSSSADGIENVETVTIGDSHSRKKIRMDDGSTCGTKPKTHLWNKAELLQRIQEITRLLQDISGLLNSWWINFILFRNKALAIKR